MFEKGKFYKHKNMLDVCFKMIHYEVLPNSSINSTISWYLLKNLTPMGLFETIVIKAETTKDYLGVKKK